MKTLILSTSSSNPEWSGGCDFAIITISGKLSNIVRNREHAFINLKVKDKDLYEIYFWDYNPEFFSPYIDEDDFSDEFERLWTEDNIWEQPKSLIIPEKAFARIECPQMIIREEGVAWVVIPKHSDVYVTTVEISYDYF